MQWKPSQGKDQGDLAARVDVRPRIKVSQGHDLSYDLSLFKNHRATKG